jgi:hypothetical protein
MTWRRCIIAIMPVVWVIIITSPVSARQLDYTGDDRSTGQTWRQELWIPTAGLDSFSVRLLYPNYTMVGRWASYRTDEIEITVQCYEVGTYWYELHHYNQGYSNQGVWLKVMYPPGDIWITYRIKQSVTLNLLGHNYALQHFTNNGWMNGTEFVDANSPVVASVLNEAKLLQGDWHQRAYWKEPEQIVNWMCEELTWEDTDAYTSKSASQTLTHRYGDCDDWAHAACALLIKAGIAARVVVVGALTSYNETIYSFPKVGMHVCLSYWDGFGWVMIDPSMSSGFTFISRVFLGADQDVDNLKIITDPEYLIYHVQGECFCEDGNQYGLLTCEGARCRSYWTDVLEHYELPNPQPLVGTEPRNCIIPNVVTAVEEGVPDARGAWIVNYPNPFNPVTTFRFQVERERRVSLEIYSVDGRLVGKVVDEWMSPGEREVRWEARGLATGIYFACLRGAGVVETRKIVILK